MKKSISLREIGEIALSLYTLNEDLHDRSLKEIDDYRKYLHEITEKGTGIPRGDFGLFCVKSIVSLSKEIDDLRRRINELEKESDK